MALFEDKKPGQGSELLQPIAAITLNEETDSKIGLLENFAATSNSHMVYAYNEAGEKVAVGIFVTENFDENACNNCSNCYLRYEDADDDQKINGNGQWVAAEEECVSESTADIKNDGPSDKSCKVVRVYKVNKGKNKATTKRSFEGKKANTLNEIKNSIKSSVKKENLVRLRPKLKRRRKRIVKDSNYGAACKKRKHRKRKEDRTFPVSNSIRHLKFECEFLFHFYCSCHFFDEKQVYFYAIS